MREENITAAAAVVDIDENEENIAAAAVAVAAGSVTVTIGFIDVAVLGFVAVAAVVDNNKKYIKNMFL